MDLSELKGIINLMQKSDLSELEIELQDLKLRLARPTARQAFEPVLQQPVPISQNVNEKPEAKISPHETGIETFNSLYGRHILS